MSVGFDPAPALRLLLDAWASPDRIDPLPEAVRPRTLEEGYALQGRLAAELGEPIGGYKLGLSSPAGMERSGLGAPVVGFVPASRIHRSGVTLDMPREGTFLIEVEVAFTLGRRIAPGEKLADIRAAIASVHLAFEIVRPRFKDRIAAGVPSWIGDGAGAFALVIGDPIAIADLPLMLAEEASLLKDGAVAVGPAIGRECPDPFDALSRLLPLAAAHGMKLETGTVVATGDLVLPYETAEPGLYQGTLPPASVNFRGRAPSA